MKRSWYATPYALWMLMFTVVPLLFVCYFAFTTKSGEFTVVPSLKIPSECIKGSVGAGDAFCAGSLYGILNDWADKDILAFASSAAACNLFSENSVDGMLDKDSIMQMESKYGRIVL